MDQLNTPSANAVQPYGAESQAQNPQSITPQTNSLQPMNNTLQGVSTSSSNIWQSGGQAIPLTLSSDELAHYTQTQATAAKKPARSHAGAYIFLASSFLLAAVLMVVIQKTQKKTFRK